MLPCVLLLDLGCICYVYYHVWPGLFWQCALFAPVCVPLGLWSTCVRPGSSRLRFCLFLLYYRTHCYNLACSDLLLLCIILIATLLTSAVALAHHKYQQVFPAYKSVCGMCYYLLNYLYIQHIWTVSLIIYSPACHWQAGKRMQQDADRCQTFCEHRQKMHMPQDSVISQPSSKFCRCSWSQAWQRWYVGAMSSLYVHSVFWSPAQNCPKVVHLQIHC